MDRSPEWITLPLVMGVGALGETMNGLSSMGSSFEAAGLADCARMAG
jgi:hypothetical protein